MSLSTDQYGYLIDPLVPITDATGTTIKDGFLRVYIAGSSTPVITYRNYDGAANEQTIELDNSGRCKYPVIVSKSLAYKVVVYDAQHSQETPIITVDKMFAIGASVTAGAGSTIVQGLDNVEGESDGFVKASVTGTTASVKLDAANVSHELTSDAAVGYAANAGYMVPALSNDPDNPGDPQKLPLSWIWGNRLNAVHTKTEISDFADENDGFLVDSNAGPKFMKWTSLANKVLGFIKSLSTTITAFRTGDVIPVDGPNGPAKMSKDSLLKEAGLSGAFIYNTSTYSDWNDLPMGKSVLISVHLDNEPSGVDSACIGVTIGSWGADNFAFQFCYDITANNQLYFRKMQSNSWTAWNKVASENFLEGKLAFLAANLEGNVSNSDATPSTWTTGYWTPSGTASSSAGKYTIVPTTPGDIVCICGYTHKNTSCIVALENNTFQDGTKLQHTAVNGNNCTYAVATSAYTGICFWYVDANTRIYKLNAGLFSETIKLLMDFPSVQNDTTETKTKTKFLVDNLEKAGNENVTPSTFTKGYWNKSTGNWVSSNAARATIVPTDVGDVIAIYGYCHSNTAPVVALTENSFVGGTVLATVASSGENILLVKATSAYTGVCFWHSTIEDSEIQIYKLKNGIFKQVKENADAIDVINSELQNLQPAKTFYVGYGTADGVTHFDKVWDAMEATTSETGWVNIEIYSGTYDLYTEMGGVDYLSTITDTYWRNWVPVLHKVRMRGQGDVKITYMPPQEVAALYPNANNVISILNVGGDCEIENLTLEGQYCRYIIHDQVASHVAEERISTKVYKNLRCKMIKTSAYGQVVGGGFDLHQVIKYIDCYFEGCPTQSTWSYHQGQCATFVIDNCVFFDNSNKDYCVRFGNKPGTTSTYRCPVRFSNCFFSKAIRLNREWGDIQSVNNFDITITNSNSVNVTLADEISDIVYTPKIYNTIS